MRAYATVTRARGVVTVSVDLREAAGVEENTELTWVEVAPGLWLVGPAAQHPEVVAPTVEATLLAQSSPFPTLMRRLLTGDIPQRVGPGYHRSVGHTLPTPTLTEEQMIARGAPTETPIRRRGHR
jgi:hypothetical protein